MKNFFSLTTGVLAMSLLVAGCAKNKDVEPTITNIAVTNPDFQTLEDAAIRGDVAVLLGNKNAADPSGNFTVFAPTNAAFARLGLNSATDLTALQQPFLRSTLFYHVFSGTLPGSALTAGSTSVSALGVTRRIIQRADSSKYVNGSKILGTDVTAANGLIHPIDKVLLATGGNVVESAVALSTAKVFVKPELTFLVAAVLRCNLQGLLSQPGPYTVFAPTDQAFIDAGIPNIDAINKMDVNTLTGILANHVLSNSSAGQLGNKFTPELPAGSSVTAFGGRPLALGAFTDGVLTVKGAGNPAPANMVIPDVQCTNGVVHVIDRVLLP
ncbi:fasciclin domain-containing protein [Hymenobacter properus]|uniref:Fasciclin domain-containing protein n=1 Tax=Hymenobacter properus TaxID=2791026 RepID=A0A931BEB3_9BACT|nr:fasciclin domain-containing protein [Hymenobacter properus]MBF9140976.1 fasciclin domain-containing protein [Hymenobacter properus]MBR7719785.1 fasciclin domain-containing protein [Microvirga sp. SRT04]